MAFGTLRHVMDLVERPPAVDPYTRLKERLVLAHQLSPVQKATKLLQLPATSEQRPSELLASLLEFCPPGEEDTALFRASFTSRLPAAIQILVADKEMGQLKDLALTADRLWLCHGAGAQPVLAVNDGEAEDTVAAIPGKGRPGGKPTQTAAKPEGRQRSATVCWRHIKYGKNAFGCADKKNCAMNQGN